MRLTSLSDGHILQVPKVSVAERVDFTVLAVASNFDFFVTLSGLRVYVDIWGLKSQKGRGWNINHICYHCHDP